MTASTSKVVGLTGPSLSDRVGRASVMEYPGFRDRVEIGQSAVGLGAWS